MFQRDVPQKTLRIRKSSPLGCRMSIMFRDIHSSRAVPLVLPLIGSMGLSHDNLTRHSPRRPILTENLMSKSLLSGCFTENPVLQRQQGRPAPAIGETVSLFFERVWFAICLANRHCVSCFRASFPNAVGCHLERRPNWRSGRLGQCLHPICGRRWVSMWETATDGQGYGNCESPPHLSADILG